MQPGVPRGAYQTPGSAGMLDFGRFGGPPQSVAGSGRAMGYPQGGFLDEATAYTGLEENWSGVYTGLEDDWSGAATRKGGAASGAQAYAGAQAGSAYSYLGAQAQAAGAAGACGVGTVGASASHATSGSAAASSVGAGAQKSASQPPDLARALLHAQPPPPPSQAPHVPPTHQPPVPQGPPPPAPPLMSPPSQPSQPSRSSEMSDEEERAAREKYGLLGILKVIRMTDPDLNTLALGMDLTTLGLNLNSPECLYATFASPWSDTPARKDPEFYLPPCYYMNPPQLKTAHLQKFSLETLFYIFFNMPRDTLQACAAAELYNRGWKYYRDLKAWFMLQEEEDGTQRWVCFDPNTWEKHYYLQPLDPAGFLGEDDVRVKMPPSGGMPPAPASS